ncbi:ABC transporter ATP-binding protein [Enterocloster bolteae]|uniref:ABC transporter ATP-binding protein n=1 Tax=Enterocloster bolteae TaxID=208479 RepID=UPI00189D5A4A|nr:ABC transporter ATP-binding protein [Enterocloster bolteae]
MVKTGIKKIRLIIKIFDKKQKVSCIYMTFIMLINTVLELIGVSAIIPIINAIAYPKDMNDNIIINYISRIFRVTTPSIIVLLLAIGVSLIYIIKNTFSLYTIHKQIQFSYMGQRDLSNKLMKATIYQNYAYHKKKNSAEIMRDVRSDTSMFYVSILNLLQLISESFISLAIVIYLAIVDMIITLGVIFCLAVTLAFFSRYYRRQISFCGYVRRESEARVNKDLLQILGGIKEIKVTNKEKYFLSRYYSDNAQFADSSSKYVFVTSLSKPIMEALVVTALMLLISIEFYFGMYGDNFITTLAVFAVAMFRLMPSVNKISSYLGCIITNIIVVDNIYNNLQALRGSCLPAQNEKDKKNIEFRDKLSLRNVSFSYEDSDYYILENVNIDILKNQSVAFIGPSGAGKSTLADIILGLLKINQGKILIDGNSIDENLCGWHKIIGYIPQTIYLLDDTIRNNVAFGVKEDEIDDEEIMKVLKDAQLSDFVLNSENGLNTLIGENGVRLSGGQRQRIGIARALYEKPQILILDEATSALDQDTERAVMEAVDYLQGRMTLIIIAHRLTTIKNCDVVYEVRNKKITKREDIH